MDLKEAIEDVEISFKQLEFSTKLLQYCEDDRINISQFDIELTIETTPDYIVYNSGNFPKKDDIIKAAQINYLITEAATAITLDKAIEIKGIKKDTAANDRLGNIVLLIYMIRCAYAHGISEPKWEVRGKYNRKIQFSINNHQIDIDLEELNGQDFTFDKIGGHKVWQDIKEEVIKILTK